MGRASKGNTWDPFLCVSTGKGYSDTHCAGPGWLSWCLRPPFPAARAHVADICPAGCWGSPSWSFLLLTGTVCLFITRSAHLGTLLDQSGRASGLKSWLPGQADGGRAGSSGDSLGLGSAFLPSPSCEATPCDWPPGLPPQRGCVTSLVQEGGDGLGPGWGPTSKPGLPGPEKGL